MPNLVYNEASVVSSLSKHPNSAPEIFAFCCASRIINSSPLTSLDNIRISYLYETLARIKSFLLSSDLATALEIENGLLDHIDDEDECLNEEDFFFDDACAAMIYTVRSSYSDRSQNGAWSARRAYELTDRTASLLINVENYTPSAENFILNHALVQQEIRRQLRDLSQLESVHENRYDSLLDRCQSEVALRAD